MKKLYVAILITLFASNLYSQSGQVVIEAVELPGSRYHFVNKNTRIPVNELTWDEAESFVNGFAKVALDHKWGFIDRTGNPVIAPAYESVRSFRNNLAAVKQNSKWGFIDEKGTTIIPFEYDIVYDFKEPVTAVYKNSKWFLMNKQGIITKSLDIDIFWGFKNGSARITRNGQTGVMNTKGEVTLTGQPIKPQAKNTTNTTALRTTDAGVCPENIGFEYGNFTNWNSYIGSVAAVGTNNVITVSPSPPTANRHVIYTSTNPAPSPIDPYGLFPVNPPDGSRYGLKLGNNVNGAEAERVTYQISVPANSTDASITYRYAVVFQDPGHLVYQQPRFSAKLLDVATNTYLPCASYEYVSTSVIPGFLTSPVDDSVRFKPWSNVFINLSAYAGRTLILEFTTADCTRGAHWGYAYVDVGDCNITANIQYNCTPSFANLSGPGGFEFYNWWDQNFTTLLGSGENITLTPAPALNSTLHVEVIPFNGFGCSDTLEVVVINTVPTANAGPDKTICPGARTTIGTTPVPGNLYTWSPATYLSSTIHPSPVVSAPVTTTYVLTANNTINGCMDTDTVTVFVDAKPAPAFTAGPRQCLNGNNFSFPNTTTGGVTYNWSFGDGNTSLVTSPTHNYTGAGTYTVKMIATASTGCKDSVSHPVTIDPTPVVIAGIDRFICRGNSVQLQVTGAQIYDWTPALGLDCTDCPGPIASPLNSTTYIVRGANSFGCPANDTIAVTVHQPIDINVSPDRIICDRETVNLQVTGTAATYIWSPAQGLSNASIPNPVATPTISTQYRVIGYDGHNCFTDTGYVNITVNPVPSIELGPNQTLATGTLFTINPVVQNGPIIQWEWTPATNLSCNNCPVPVATVKKDITYHAFIRNIYNCTAIDSVTIHTFCEGSQVFIPNAFTPDGDGVNDILMVRAKGVETVRSFRIFTRWGELVFEKTNFPPNTPAFGWDGKIKGKTGAAEVYVYTAEVTCDNLQTYTYKGNISILK
jgi:gliding motility-associated-like protein